MEGPRVHHQGLGQLPQDFVSYTGCWPIPLEKKPIALTQKSRFYILITELNRLWEFWLGLPVTPRMWGFARPNIDEL